MDEVQRQTFPRLTTAANTPSPSPSPTHPTFALYIDADNQSYHTAAALLDVLQHGVGGEIIRATVACNDKANKNAGWITALREQIPALTIETLSVPCRPNSADIALILALGANLAEHRRTQARVVVVSRDTLLLDAAEQVKEAGVHLYVAYADGEVPTARRTSLTTFLLPSPTEPAKMAAPTAAPNPPQPIAPIRTAVPKDVAKAMAHIRTTCKQQPGGGYSATDVGQALTNLGYKTPASRRQIVKQFPNLKEQGQAAQKRLVF